jgi:predicted nucleic-acid-binding protein
LTEALDANVVLRHFTGQPPELAARATNALVEAPPRSLFLADLTVSEIVYVLQGVYSRPREEVARLVEATISLASVRLDDEGLIRRTLEHYGRRGMDWPDAYLVAMVEVRKLDGLLSFDRLDAKLRGLQVKRREP